MGGDVEGGGGDGDITVGEGPVVGVVGLGLVVLIVAYHPMVVVAARMVAGGEFVVPGALGHAADADTFIARGIWEVDVQTDTLGQSVIQDVAGVLDDVGAEGFEVCIGVVVAEREGD